MSDRSTNRPSAASERASGRFTAGADPARQAQISDLLTRVGLDAEAQKPVLEAMAQRDAESDRRHAETVRGQLTGHWGKGPIPNPQELYARLQAQGARRQAPSKGTPAGAPDLHPELEAQKRAQIEAAWRMREQQRAASPGVER